MGALKLAGPKKRVKMSPLARAKTAHQQNPLDQQAILTLSDLYEAKNLSKKAQKLWLDFLSEQPKEDSARIHLATLLYRQKDFNAAYDQFLQVNSFGSFAAQALNGAGACCYANGNCTAAVEHYAEAIKLNNQAYPYYLNMAFSLVQLEKYDDAVESTRIAYALSARDSAILSSAADNLMQFNGYEAAITLYHEFLEVAPTNAQAHINLGLCYRILGQYAKAEATMEKALSLEPENPVFLYSYAGSVKGPALLKRAESNNFDRETAYQRTCYHFSMAIAQESVGDYAQAFEHFEKANAELFRGAPSFGTIEPTELELSKSSHQVANAPTPIFIVGLPRSGTTLLERIVGAHSEVSRAGERAWLKSAIHHAKRRQEPDPKERAFRVAETYCRQIPPSLKEAKYLTDKMPSNFRYLKLAALAFPNAKFIHVHRDPRAVAWSNYSNYFTKGGSELGFSTHRDSILEYMKNHRREVASWVDLPKGRVIHLDYEALVQSPKEISAQLIADLGLPDEGDLSDKTSSDMAIRTASVMQARKKVYQNSSQMWKNYEAFAPDWFQSITNLGPLRTGAE